MSNAILKFQILACLLIALVLTACSKPSAEVMAPDQVPGAINQAFGKTAGETKDMAADVVSACQKQDPVAAFTNLQALSQKKDLTPEQRSVAAHAMVAELKQMQTASANGDAAAQAALHQYMSNR